MSARHAYFFKRAGYVRYNIDTDLVDVGPAPIAQFWTHLPAEFQSDVDAVVNWGDGHAYFFKRAGYVRYNIATDLVDVGPAPIAQFWTHLPREFQSDLDAVVNWGDGHAYFFKGAGYVRYNIDTDLVDVGPAPIAQFWTHLPREFHSHLDAVFEWNDGRSVVHNGITGQGALIVNDYYRLSHRETVGHDPIDTEETTHAFRTLDELFEQIRESPDQTHIVVAHGNPDQGLLIRFSRNSQFNATGLVVGRLADLADALEQGAQPPERLMDLAAAEMGMSQQEVRQLIEKSIEIRKRRPILHLRGCDLGRETMLRDYRRLFGAARVTAPRSRMFYVRIRPGRPPLGTSIANLAARGNPARNTRRRLFPPPAATAVGPLLIDIRDNDGHTNVESPLSLLDNPAQAPTWGQLLLGRWEGANNEFVLPLLWENTEQSFHCPLERGYRERLAAA